MTGSSRLTIEAIAKALEQPSLRDNRRNLQSLVISPDRVEPLQQRVISGLLESLDGPSSQLDVSLDLDLAQIYENPGTHRRPRNRHIPKGISPKVISIMMAAACVALAIGVGMPAAHHQPFGSVDSVAEWLELSGTTGFSLASAHLNIASDRLAHLEALEGAKEGAREGAETSPYVADASALTSNLTGAMVTLRGQDPSMKRNEFLQVLYRFALTASGRLESLLSVVPVGARTSIAKAASTAIVIASVAAQMAGMPTTDLRHLKAVIPSSGYQDFTAPSSRDDRIRHPARTFSRNPQTTSGTTTSPSNRGTDPSSGQVAPEQSETSDCNGALGSLCVTVPTIGIPLP